MSSSRKKPRSATIDDDARNPTKRHQASRNNTRGPSADTDDELNHDNEDEATRSTDDRKHDLRHRDYTVGWIAALWIELAAAQSMLDDIHKALPSRDDDSNTYVLGRVAEHNIAIACLPAGHYGNNNAAIVASNMRRTFPSIRRVLMVGIGGGVPDFNDIRLGDIVVSLEVLQCDFGKAVADGQFQHTGIPVRPQQKFLTAISKMRANHALTSSQVPRILSEMIQRYPSMARYSHPHLEDRLFPSTFRHTSAGASCDDCDDSEDVKREPRPDDNPRIHYGRIASGNRVVKDGKLRSKLAEELDVLCFDMEAAGVMDLFPALVIRGICDYSDSHKNKQWQEYAAGVAAAYARELLVTMSGDHIIDPLSEEKLLAPQPDCSTAPRDQFRDSTAPPLDLLDSLNFDEINFRHAAITAAHAKTCEWVLDNTQFVAWRDADSYQCHHGFLWISGKPGAGKSTLMKFLVARAQSLTANLEDVAVASFFFNARGAELEKSALGMYRSLLFQLLDSFEDLQEVSRGHPNWTVKMLQGILVSTIPKLGKRRLVCFIDALDECDEQQVLDFVDFFENLSQLAFENKVKVYICFASRHYPYIEIQNGLRFTLEEQPGHDDDLRNYVLDKLRTGNDKMTGDVAKEVLAKASGVFLWVVLVVEILNGEFRRGRLFAVKQRLRELPSRLSELFKDLIRRDNENLEETLLCIQWILYAKRPLDAVEFYFAVNSGLDPSLRHSGPWNEQELSFVHLARYVLNSSKGLAEVAGSGIRVQFIHESVRDFLIKDNGIRSLWPGDLEDFEHSSHERLKNCCCAHIQVASLYVPNDWGSGKFPFISYVTRYVFYHADAASRRISQTPFLRHFDLEKWFRLKRYHDALQQVDETTCSRHADYDDLLIHLYCQNTYLAYVFYEANPDNLLEDLSNRYSRALGCGCGLNYEYMLIKAAVQGDDELVAKLLQSVNTCRSREIDGLALYFACKGGHALVVKLLLAKMPNIIVERSFYRMGMYPGHVSNDVEIMSLLQAFGFDIESGQ